MRIAAAAAILVTAGAARADGPALPIRGVRALERAGALVAGADDADALFGNPAGLALLAKDQRALLFDAAYVYQTVEITPPGAPHTTNLQPGHPLPTIAGALGLGDGLVIAGGLTAPYDAIHRFAPDSAARFASLDTTGSYQFTVAAGIAYRASEHLRIGATLQDVVTHTAEKLVTTACTAATCDPADASLDMELDLAETDYLAPAGSVGLQYSWSPRATFGLVAQSPVRVSADGALGVHLPTSAMFAQAKVTGDRAALSYTLPPSVRAGLEVRPRPDLRIEAAIDVELWSLPGDVTLAPRSVQIEGVTGGPYALHDLAIARHGETSFAPSLGVEWHGHGIMLGAGYAYQTAALPAGDVSARAVDAAKHIIGLGGGYDADGWQIGAAVGIALAADVDVSASDAAVAQQAPLREPTTTQPINTGRYSSRYLVGGLRFARRF